MKKLCLITLGLCALSLVLPTDALAAKADGKKAKLVAKYDKNKNGTLEADEKKAIKEDFAKDKNGDLKAFDKDGDGKLSDEEIDAIKAGSGKAKEASAKGKKKTVEKAAEEAPATKAPDAEKSKADK
jgi:hypothetical protein